MIASTATPRTGPYSDLLVIDLTHVLNGPYCTTLLADLGARVIKVETPGHGDDTRTYGPFANGRSLYFDCVNRGKESVVLDLKDDADRAIFLNMVSRADVLAENFRPGVMSRLGFSYEELSKINPGLVYASSSGFGQSGPLAAAPAYDTIIQAMSGIMSMTGFPNGAPTRVGTSLADLLGGTFMFCGIASALYARSISGKGARVDISMFDATLAFLEHGFMEYAATGQALPRIGNRHPFMAPFDLFACADGSIVICCGNDRLFAQLCKALDLNRLSGDERFHDNASRAKNNSALKQELENVLRTQSAEHWLRLLGNAGVPAGPLLDVAQAIEHPQTKARNMLIEAGGLKMAGNPIKIGGYPDPTVRPAAPRLDEHGAGLRQEFAVAPVVARRA